MSTNRIVLKSLPMDIISTRISKFRKNAAIAAMTPDTKVAIKGVPVSWKIGLKNL